MALDPDDATLIWGGDFVSAVLNVASNIFLLPATALALGRRDYASAVVYTYVFVGSVLYHMCRAGLACLYQFEKHQMTDYIFVYYAIIWVLSRLSVRSAREHLLLYIFFAGLVTFAVMAQAGEALLPFVGIGLPLLNALLLSLLLRRRMFRQPAWAAVTFALIGVAGAFMFLAAPSDYWWAHPAWHLFSMTATFTAELATFNFRPR